MSKKLKILFLVPSFPTVSETFIVNQIIELIDRGHEINIFATEKKVLEKINTNIRDYSLIDKTIYANIPSNPIKRIAKAFTLLRKSKHKRKLLKTLNITKHGIAALTLSTFYKVAWLYNSDDDYQVVHAHFGFMSDYYFNAKVIGFFKKSKLVTTFHGYDIHPGETEINKIRYKQLLESRYPITVNTIYTKNLILKVNQNFKNIHISPVSLDTNFFKPKKRIRTDQDKINILFCGRIITFKGASRIPQIANVLVNKKEHKNVSFNIVGNSDEKNDSELNKLKNDIEKYNLEDSVHLLGSKTQNELIDILNTTDIYIMPGITDTNGRAENQGLVIQEAQAMEIPVIVTSAGGMQYGLIDGETGYVVDQNSNIDFADKIEILLKDNELRQQMSLAARQFVIKNYDSKYIINQLEAIYYNQ